MQSNTKLLVLGSFSIIISGFILLWIGFRSTSVPVVDNTPRSTGSITSTSLSTGSLTINTLSATSSAVVGIEGERALVTKVIDGDTIELENGKTVRLIGIDTPETVDLRRPVGCFGKEASNEMKNLLTGKTVILQKDISETDKYGRLLRLIFLPLDNGNLLFVNDYLVREGYAKVYTFSPDVKYSEQFREAEQKAREFKKGLWGRC